MNHLDLSTIIVNWKSRAFVRQCLASICSNAYPIAYEIFVVDNASFDGCEQMLKSEFPQFIFIQSKTNLGFAGANNLAFALSTGRNVLFLNPDTEIHGEAIQKLISALESAPDIGMAGAHLLNSDFTLQTSCITTLPSILNQTLNSNYLRKTFPRWGVWGMRPLFEGTNEPVQVEAISGACMLARHEVIERVNCFSTDYFIYAEDMDLCLKIAKTDWKIFYVPDAVIVHHAGGSSSNREESNFSNIMLRNALIDFFTLHRGPRYAFLYRFCMVLNSTLRILLLLAALPISIVPRGYRFITYALRKWSSILGWSLGLTKWGGSTTATAPNIMASVRKDIP